MVSIAGSTNNAGVTGLAFCDDCTMSCAIASIMLNCYNMAACSLGTKSHIISLLAVVHLHIYPSCRIPSPTTSQPCNCVQYDADYEDLCI